jgi:hypothetical protein
MEENKSRKREERGMKVKKKNSETNRPTKRDGEDNRRFVQLRTRNGRATCWIHVLTWATTKGSVVPWKSSVSKREAS